MRKLVSLTLILVLLVMAVPALAQDSTNSGANGPESGRGIRDFDDILVLRESNSTGSTYLLHEHHGGNWCDAEKIPGDDGAGNPPPVNPGEEDDLMCWAGAASNVLEWTGWGLVVHTTAGDITNTDDIFQHFQDHWIDTGGYEDWGWEWWLNGTAPAGLIDVAGGGNFWPSYTWTDYFHEEWDQTKTLQAIDTYSHNGWGMTLGFPTHAVTCWGFDYDPDEDKDTDPEDYYLGVWLTDPDDDKGTVPAPDMLRYYAVEYDSTNNRWFLPGYQGGWYIESIFALEPFPNTQPISDADGPYTNYEGSSITFDGSGSSDPDGNPLQYRWDFDNDGNYDTAWSTNPYTSYAYPDDYSGFVVLEVSDYMTSVTDSAIVTISNVAPTADAGADQTVNEGDTVSFSGSFTDPGTSDTHTIEWDFGDSNTDSGSLTPTHVYCDNGFYTVTLTVTDDDGGSDTDTLNVTVNNVAPTADAGADQTVNEGDTVSFSGSFTDPGTCDTHTIEWDFGDGNTDSGSLTPTHVYGDNGIFTVTLTVTDDDGGVGTDSLTVTVNNVAPTISDESMAQPNDQFILPIVHTLDFEATVTDPGSDDLTFVWDWGDMTGVTNIYYNDGMGPDPYPSPEVNPMNIADPVSHVYMLPGDYPVSLTVTDDDGGSDTYTEVIHIHNVEEALDITNAYIQGLDDSYFKGKADKRKAAIDKMFAAIDDMLADEEYKGMIEDLRNNIRTKADGTVDGKANNDWITDPTAQQEICHKIDDITAYLETLL